MNFFKHPAYRIRSTGVSAVISVGLVALGCQCVAANAQSASTSATSAISTTSALKPVDPTKTFTVPPLPNGSAQAKPHPGMSDEAWAEGYKETGRPKFNLNTVVRVSGTVERN